MEPPPAPKWVPDTERPSCRACQVQFSWLVRRHHCRICGEIYCDACTRRRAYIGTEDLVRVCDCCHGLFRKGGTAKPISQQPDVNEEERGEPEDIQGTSFGMGTGVLLACAVVCAFMDWSLAPADEEDSLRWWRGFLISASLAVCAYSVMQQLRKCFSKRVGRDNPPPTTAAPSPATTTSTAEASSKMHEEARAAVKKAFEKALPFALEGWNPPQTVHGAQLSRKKMEGAPLDPIQIEGLVRGVTPKILCELLQNGDFRKITQPNTKYSECLERVGEDISIMIEETSLPWPVANRDAVFVSASQPYNNDGLLLVKENFECALRPAQSTPVRARTSSVFLITMEPGPEKLVRLKMSSVFDPRGNIPISLVNALISENCKIFTKMNECIESPQGQAIIASFKTR